MLVSAFLVALRNIIELWAPQEQERVPFVVEYQFERPSHFGVNIISSSSLKHSQDPITLLAEYQVVASKAAHSVLRRISLREWSSSFWVGPSPSSTRRALQTPRSRNLT